MSPPPYRLSPRTTSSMSIGSIPDRRTASATTWVASSKASTSISDPLNAGPIGVRAVDTITASCMFDFSSDRVWIDCSRTAGLPRPVMPPQAGTAQPGLLRREPQGAVQADVLAVEGGVADDRLDHQGELLGLPHPLGEHDPLRRILLEVREGTDHERRPHPPGGDGADPDADRCQVPGHG